MLKITETIPDFETYSTVLGYDSQDSLFFDIETTGLSPARSMVFLIGTVHYENGSWQMTQLLAQSAADEKELLLAFFQLARRFRLLIHFNGTTFDIPYLKERACHYMTEDSSSQESVAPDFSDWYHSFCQMNSLDLYQHFRPLKKLLNLPRMNQQTLEQYLSWSRTDQLTGKHMISLFQKYAVSGESLIADLLLLHNHDDLTGMSQILKLTSYQMLFEGAVKNVTADRSAIHSGQLLHIHFELEQPLPVPFHLNDTFGDISGTHLSLTVSDSHGQLALSCYHGELKFFFPDYRNYYYLPSEDQAIHKSIGAFVDPAHRENARPATCYIKKQGCFLRQFEPVIEPVFRSYHNSRELYFECTEEFCSNAAQLLPFLRSVLKMIR